MNISGRVSFEGNAETIQDNVFRSDDAAIPKTLQKTSLGFIANPKRKRSLYYMSIMEEAHLKMKKDAESEESFRKRFIAERSRQFSLVKLEESHLKRQTVAQRDQESC
ncbi:hypothetical protein ACROYT_G013990 [Oculina patagonica]